MVVGLCALLLGGCALGSHDAPGRGDDPVIAALAAVERGDTVTPEVAETIRRRHPMLADLSAFATARATLATGDLSATREQLEAFVTQYPDSIWIGQARLLGGRVFARLGNTHTAREWVTASRGRLRTGSPAWISATLDAAELAHSEHDDEQGLALAHGVRRAKPKSLAARRARRLCDRIRTANPALAHLPEQRLAEGESRLRENDADGARAEALALGEAPNALWLRARAERALGMRTEAEATCTQLGRGKDPLAPRALSTLATWRWNRDDDAGAIASFTEVVARFPDSDTAADAQYSIGRIHQEARHYADAFTAFKAVVDRWPEASVTSEARWRLGWVRYLASDFRGAARWFGRALRGKDRGARPAAEYWRARALGRQHDPRATVLFAHIVDRHSTSYYGLLAAERLGRIETGHREVHAPATKFPDELPGPHAERARLFVELGLPRLARLELDAERTGSSPDRRLAQAYLAAGSPADAIRVGQSLPRHPPLRTLYPLAWWPEIAPRAAAVGIDPLLVMSLARQESQFEPQAVSAADAHGLMQLLPSTARRVADANHLPPPTVESLHDPAMNVTLGTHLLRELLDRYRGSVVRALAAYNAGEAAVAKWETRYGSRPEDEFVELISYRETRSYVRLVLRNLAIYRQLYAASPSASSTGSPPKAPLDITTTTSPGRAEPST